MGVSSFVRKWQDLAFDAKLRVIIPATIAVLSAIAVPTIGALTGGDDERPPPPATSTDLEFIDVRVANDHARADADGNPLPSVPSVAIRLHNRGNQRTILTNAKLSVREVAAVDFCQAGGTLDVSGNYDVVLPASAEVGDTLDVPLSQQLGADQADVFTISFTTDPDDDQFQYRIYELGLSLEHDTDRVLDAGSFLISVPLAPFDFDLLTDENKVSSEAACYAANEAAVARILDGGAVRSEQFDELAAYLETRATG